MTSPVLYSYSLTAEFEAVYEKINARSLQMAIR